MRSTGIPTFLTNSNSKHSLVHLCTQYFVLGLSAGVGFFSAYCVLRDRSSSDWIAQSFKNAVVCLIPSSASSEEEGENVGEGTSRHARIGNISSLDRTERNTHRLSSNSSAFTTGEPADTELVGEGGPSSVVFSVMQKFERFLRRKSPSTCHENNLAKGRGAEAELAESISSPTSQEQEAATVTEEITPRHQLHEAPTTTEEIMFRDRSNSLISASSAATTTNQNRRVVEILVHNVSHSDMVLSLGRWRKKGIDKPGDVDLTSPSSPAYERGSESEDLDIFCRPRFSAFDLFSRRVFAALMSSSHPSTDCDDGTVALNTHPEQPIISFPRYERSQATPRYTLVTPQPSRQKLLPVGFALTQFDENTRIDARRKDIAKLRIRGKDVCKVAKEELELQQRINQLHSETEWMGSCHSDGEISSPTSEVVLSEQEETYSEDKEDLYINRVFFPLLSPLILGWEQRIKDKYHRSLSSANTSAVREKNVKKVVILVTGLGTPRNWTHSITGNSTEFCAKIMELFLNQLYPDVTVVRIHSQTNIFRYDENISFAKRELMPCIEAYRDAHARGESFPDEVRGHIPLTGGIVENGISASHKKPCKDYNPDWRDSFHVTLSFADGSPARTHAIQAALRPYRPTYFHFWQLKTFWHASKISEEDIEILTFEDMETVPAMEVSKTSEKVQMVVQELQRFKSEFLERNAPSSRSDLRRFWLRKTQKPVLAVLLVETPEGKPLLYRGTNMEVSMPTGSLCAERSVIGSALANNPGLKREDLRMVAVLAVHLPREDTSMDGTHISNRGPVADANVCGFTISSIDTNLHLREAIEGKARDGVRRSASIASFASIMEDDHESVDRSITETWARSANESERYTEEDASSQVHPLVIGPVSLVKDGHEDITPEKQVKHINLYTNSDAESDAGSEYGQPSRSKKPVMGGGRMQKKTVLVHHETDLNPLRPCGACNEWLKKIAEPNPNFKILTFTDADCTGVYVTPCQY